tara:strand:- start:279 stop:680 length:402 start_codon:yes stop_codon:yes gene_type:complete
MNIGETIMRITNRQKELIAEKIVKKFVRNFKSKSVAKHPTFVKYKKLKDKADALWEKYDGVRTIYYGMQPFLSDEIFGEDVEHLEIDTETGTVKVNRWALKDNIIDELHFMELSSHENIDDIINEVLEKFEVK